MNPSMRIRTVAAALLLGGLSAAHLARAEYPESPVRIVVNAAPGGAADATTREVAAELSQRLGHHFIIDNKPGAARAVGLNEVAKAAPDGYVIGNNNLAIFVVSALTAKHLPCNVDWDFTPVAKVFTQANLVGVRPSLPVKTLNERVAYASTPYQGWIALPHIFI